MSDGDRGIVRPTKRCLEDLSIEPPYLTEPLEGLDHPLVEDAQQVPQREAAGGARRVVSLTDRVWFKCRHSNRRGIVSKLADSEVPTELEAAAPRGLWWLGAAGLRQNDSHDDFYKAIAREAKSDGKHTVDTSHLLPGQWDVKRLVAERGVAWRADLKAMVVRIIALSLRTGQLAVAEYRQHRIKALVRAEDGGDAYLAIVAEGVPDPAVFALILDCVPGVKNSDWQPEPDSVAGITPASGQIIWSTMFPPEVACQVLDLVPGGE